MPSIFLRYGVAFLTVLLALLVSLLLRSLGGQSHFLLLLAAVLCSAWYGGKGPGVLATALSVLMMGLFLMPQLHSLVLSVDNFVELVVFALVALLIISLTTARKQAEEALRKVNNYLERRIKDRTAELSKANAILQEQITKREQAEAERNQLLVREQTARKAAEAANRAKDEFLAIVSHELRSPLNAMLGWSRLLSSRKFDEATTARALEVIERNAKLQTQLIEDLLDISRIVRGNIHLHICPINLVQIIEAAIDTMCPTANAKAIEVASRLDPSAGLVSGDPNRLQQVVWNLLSNAIKFTPEGGLVKVRLERTDSHAQIKVIDTGCGISAEFLPYVFDRFRQAESTTNRTHGGLGLGLAIVRNLVELHGGTVQAESQGEGQGATFTVNLPLIGSNLEAIAFEQPMETV